MTFDERLLSQCVGCGFCLPACPTFQITRREEHGPRGRIAAMRLVDGGELPAADPGYVDSMETCVQCRACEPACPSGVQFGQLVEQARADLHGRRSEGSETPVPAARAEGPVRRVVTRVLLGVLEARFLLLALSAGISLAQLFRIDRILPERIRVPIRVRLGDLLRPPEGGMGKETAFLFRGCVMDAWFRPVHRASARVLVHAGLGIRTDPAPDCCGAIHLHAGREEDARRMARRVLSAYRGTDGMIVVNSAGCGAAMKEYGRLLGTAEAAEFSDRVRDFSEALDQGDLTHLVPMDRDVVYQAACHLKNVQRVDDHVTRVLARVPGLGVQRPGDGELCCGAGGAYSLAQPEFARAMRDRKVASLCEGGDPEVVSSNPGCILHLAGAGLRVRHVAEILDEALPGSSQHYSGSDRSDSHQDGG